jgi:hypothetical protein
VLVSGPLFRFGWTRWVVAGEAALVAAVLLADQDLHGGGLAVALVAALAVGRKVVLRPAAV